MVLCRRVGMKAPTRPHVTSKPLDHKQLMQHWRRDPPWKLKELFYSSLEGKREARTETSIRMGGCLIGLLSKSRSDSLPGNLLHAVLINVHHLVGNILLWCSTRTISTASSKAPAVPQQVLLNTLHGHHGPLREWACMVRMTSCLGPLCRRVH